MRNVLHNCLPVHIQCHIAIFSHHIIAFPTSCFFSGGFWVDAIKCNDIICLCSAECVTSFNLQHTLPTALQQTSGFTHTKCSQMSPSRVPESCTVKQITEVCGAMHSPSHYPHSVTGFPSHFLFHNFYRFWSCARVIIGIKTYLKERSYFILMK